MSHSCVKLPEGKRPNFSAGPAPKASAELGPPRSRSSVLSSPGSNAMVVPVQWFKNQNIRDLFNENDVYCFTNASHTNEKSHQSHRCVENRLKTYEFHQSSSIALMFHNQEKKVTVSYTIAIP